jgi:rhamnogalacturonan endolyase
MQRLKYLFLIGILLVVSVWADAQKLRYMERLDRGMVAVWLGSNRVFLSWRRFGTDVEDIGFNIYRNNVKINAVPITGASNFTDTAGSLSSTYTVRPVLSGVEQPSPDSPVGVWASRYKDIPLQVPAAPPGATYTYSPNDCSVGDLDGDGQYEIVLKWDPSNSKDNSQSGYTGNVYLDAYELDGTFLWRIDLGRNIRAGAHYTQFMVYDFDNDGKAEIACKTADGTVDGLGVILGDPTADYRNSSGYILSGPEYLSIFDGQTGAFIDTVDYVPARGKVSDWGDSYGNRVDRFLACVAYLDGVNPSLVMCRGYYTRTALAAWDFIDGKLISRWVFDTGHSGGPWAAYKGQGNHNLSVADVDGDGYDEIVYGSCTIDHDGTGLYTTGLGHGDALHVSDMDPARPGLEVWMPHEGSATGASYRDAATGAILFQHLNSGDVGRGCAAHVDSRYVGYQLWSHAVGGTYTTGNTQISTGRPDVNFLVWWTGDLQRETLDAADGDGVNSVLNKWNGSSSGRLLSLYNIPTNYSTASINGTKANPCLSADILGDWREEIILRSKDNTKLRIFTTTTTTSHAMYTLMHDPQYRLAVAWQNVAYNQPPHPSFYIGTGMSKPPVPLMQYAGSQGGLLRQWWTDIPGSTVGDLTSQSAYPGNPGGSSLLHRLQGPSNWADATGTRLRGWLIPPTDGSYLFWIAADDSAELWLSTDATEANAALIASVAAWTNPMQWNKYPSQQSTSLPLQAGHKYYLEILHKDDSGDDHFAVAWMGPTVTPQVIESEYLRPWTDYVAGDVTGDTLVDLEDLSLISAQWQQVDCDFDLRLDANGDCEVNLQDLVLAAENWVVLEEKTIRIEENMPGFVLVQGTIDSNHAGFTGDGFANSSNTIGAFIEWRVFAPRAGAYDLQWRYASWSATDRRGNVRVNGATQVSNISFSNTGAWTTWVPSPKVRVQLQQGANQIRLIAETAEGLANIDWMEVTGLAPQGID